jgi:phosphatidylserine/phosphatidylglycerophosphate/cardiolipin synthase-like enzyme
MTPAGFLACVTLCFSPGDCDKKLEAFLGAARQTIDLAAYAYDLQGVTEVLIAARRRGVRVRMLVDRTQSARAAMAEQLNLLGTAGVPVRWQGKTRTMHLKLAVVDGKVGWLGSFNFTQAAAERNDEVAAQLTCTDGVQDMSKAFELRWKRSRYRP